MVDPQSYKEVWYHWTTHRPQGLSAKDVKMARLCDEKAQLLGCVVGNDGGKTDEASGT